MKTFILVLTLFFLAPNVFAGFGFGIQAHRHRLDVGPGGVSVGSGPYQMGVGTEGSVSLGAGPYGMSVYNNPSFDAGAYEMMGVGNDVYMGAETEYLDVDISSEGDMRLRDDDYFLEIDDGNSYYSGTEDLEIYVDE